MAGPTERFHRVSICLDLGGHRCRGLAAAPGTVLLLSGCQASLGTGTVVPAVLLNAAAVGALHVSLSWLLVRVVAHVHTGAERFVQEGWASRSPVAACALTCPTCLAWLALACPACLVVSFGARSFSSKLLSREVLLQTAL
jgi:predicted transporter